MDIQTMDIEELRDHYFDLLNRYNICEAKLQRSHEEMQHLVYVISHDLQEPVRKIRGFTDLLGLKAKSALDEKSLTLVKYIVGGSVRMQKMIEDLLVFSRLATKANRFQNVCTHEILENTINRFSKMIEDANARINLSEMPVVIADKDKIQILFNHLINNALKFSKKNECPEITISAWEDDKFWNISFKDAGIGIDPKFHERVFKLFQKLHARDEFEGNGAGLAVCKRIVEIHKGEIKLQSELDKGSEFVITLSKGSNDLNVVNY